MDAPETEAHAPHARTGIRWLDASLALSAFAISLISLFVAIHHGHTMQEMAAANARMVAASSWPYVQYGSSNLNAEGAPEISLDLANQGIGPARIEKFELRYRDRPVRSTAELLNACCIKQDAERALLSSSDDWQSAVMTVAVEGKIMAAHEERAFLRLRRTERNAAIWDRLNTERWQLRPRTCFCSVFDECWTSGAAAAKATRVAECPADWVSYGE
jgi:hypothetical protein